MIDQDQWSHVPDEFRRRFDRECVSIPNALRLTAARTPDLEAVVDGDLRLTYRDLEHLMVDAVRAMIAHGVEPGDRVAIWAPNSWQFIVAALGVQGAGGIIVPLNTRYRGDEAAYIVRRSGAKALFVVSDFLGTDYLGMLRDAGPDLAALEWVVWADDSHRDGAVSWNSWLGSGAGVDAADAVARIDAVTAETTADIMFTSGTTGRPKGVISTHGQALRAHGWLALVMGFRTGDRHLIIPPFFHSFGYKAGWMACVVHGVTILPQAVFTPGDVMAAIHREKVTALEGPPTLFQGILDAPDRDAFDLSSLRITMLSSTVVSEDLVMRVREELGAEVTQTCYGLTESTALVTASIPDHDSIDDIVQTVGRAVLDVEVRIVDELGDDVAPGQPGELWCRGYNVMKGYFEEPDLTAETITPEGWLRTGDIAVMDSRGFVRITDRKKDMIIIGGFNVYPAEVEQILGAFPSLQEIAVVGIPDERMGEVPVAYVVPRPDHGFDPAEFLAWSRERIANFKVPREVRVLEALPRNASMKVLRKDLRESARRGAASPG